MLQHLRGQKPIKIYNHFNNILRYFPRNKKPKNNDSLLMIASSSIESPISCKDILNSTVTITNNDSNYGYPINNKLYKIVLHYVIDDYEEYTEEIIYTKCINNIINIDHKGFSAVITFTSNTTLTLSVHMMYSNYVIIHDIVECIEYIPTRLKEDLTSNLIKNTNIIPTAFYKSTDEFVGSKLQRPIYVNGIFVAGNNYYKSKYSSGDYSGAYSTMSYSYDGRIWHTGKHNLYPNNKPDGAEYITYSQTQKLFVGCDYGFVYSSDGITWRKANCEGTIAYYYNPIFANNLWVASGGTYSEGPRYSTDGKNWYKVSGLPSNAKHTQIQFEHGLWIARVSYGDDTFGNSTATYYSINGKNWYTTNIDNYTQATLTYHNNMWMLGTEYYSTNKYTWLTPTFNPLTSLNGTISGWENKVLYANGIYVGLANIYCKLPGNSYSSNYRCLVYSTNGTEWTVVETVGILKSYSVLLNYIKGTWIAIDDKKIYTSKDGINWSLSDNSTITTQPNRIDILNGTAYCLTSDKLYYSSDGITWNYISISIPNSSYSQLNYLNGVFLITPNYSLVNNDTEDSLYTAYYSTMEVQSNDL